MTSHPVHENIASSQLAVLQDTYTVDTQSLDATYNVAVQQVNATYGVNSSVLGVSTAVNNVQSALGTYSAAVLTSQEKSAAATAAAIVKAQTDAAAATAATNRTISDNQAAVTAAQGQLAAAIRAVADAQTASAASAAAKAAADAAVQAAKDAATNQLAASSEAAKVTNYETNKAAQLNAIDWKGKSSWTVSDVAAAFAAAGTTAQLHSNQYAAIEGLPAYGSTGVYSQDIARKMYSLFLGRAATTAEDSFWTTAISSNGVNQAEKDFTSSPEYMNKIGSASSPISALYESILMRTPGASEIAYWMNSGGSLSSIKDNFLNSAEYASIRAIRGFASGGYHDGGWMMVGENGRELVNTGSSSARIYNHEQTQNLIDMSALVASNNKISKAIEGLREEMKAGDAAIALNTLRLVKILQQEFQSGGALV